MEPCIRIKYFHKKLVKIPNDIALKIPLVEDMIDSGLSGNIDIDLTKLELSASLEAVKLYLMTKRIMFINDTLSIHKVIELFVDNKIFCQMIQIYDYLGETYLNDSMQLYLEKVNLTEIQLFSLPEIWLNCYINIYLIDVFVNHCKCNMCFKKKYNKFIEMPTQSYIEAIELYNTYIFMDIDDNISNFNYYKLRNRKKLSESTIKNIKSELYDRNIEETKKMLTHFEHFEHYKNEFIEASLCGYIDDILSKSHYNENNCMELLTTDYMIFQSNLMHDRFCMLINNLTNFFDQDEKTRLQFLDIHESVNTFNSNYNTYLFIDREKCNKDNTLTQWINFFKIQPLLSRLIWQYYDKTKLLIKAGNKVGTAKFNKIKKFSYEEMIDYINDLHEKTEITSNDPVEQKLRDDIKQVQLGHYNYCDSIFNSRSEHVALLEAKLTKYVSDKKRNMQRKQSAIDVQLWKNKYHPDSPEYNDLVRKKFELYKKNNMSKIIKH
jgi:uncharacterized membrane-anchored protein